MTEKSAEVVGIVVVQVRRSKRRRSIRRRRVP